MSEFDGLFTETLLRYIRTTTEAQWAKIDPTKTHYFSTPSLQHLLSDMEAQVGVHPPIPVVSNTHLAVVSEWIGQVTLAELQSRIEALVAAHDQLVNSNHAMDVMNAWSLSVAIQGRSSDLTYLGVYLYGIGVTDGLYRPDTE